ncbi:MAG: ABC transporter ATP-binding protein [Candidatus Neomarinimicrobiota bacterium]
MSLIELKNISKIYNETKVPVTALRDVSMSIEKGDFAAIVGPSGSGKTTALNIIGGLDIPSAGEVIIDDKNLADLKSEALINFRLHHIGFVFQAYNLIPVFTARENVEFIMLLQKMPKAERNRRAVELLTAVGLSDRLDSRPSELSGGQQQRVAVARALASHPSFVLADEPTANLDSASALSLLQIMEALNHDYQMTFVFSTHDPRVIKRAHRVITLEDGQIASDVINQNAHDD